MRIRSVLFAPGNREEVLAKLPRSSPDMAVIDLEDAVPAANKTDARSVARRVVPELRAAAPKMALAVRVNAPVSEFFHNDLSGLPDDLDAVVVPKLESAVQVQGVLDAFEQHGVTAGVFAGLETAAGVERSVEILAEPGIIAAYFGAEDYMADMGGVRTSSNVEVAYARSRTVLAARLGGVPIADQVVADFRDEDRFVREAAEARAMGYSGKLCIHPAQVGLANTGFVPGPEELERATALVAAYEEALTRGEAAIAFDGQMVDEPVAQQARAMLARAQE